MSRLTLEWHLKAIMEGVPDDAYSTEFPQNGRVCTAFDVPAGEALRSTDTVAFLDAVAQDPVRPFQERNDAAELLNHHIWPESPDAGTLGRSESLLGHCDRSDIDFNEWTESNMTGRKIGPTYFSLSCPECLEGECLADPDILKSEGEAVCMTCGTEQTVPDYP